MRDQHTPPLQTGDDPAVLEERITIGKTLDIEGDLSAQENISIEGRFQGTISLDKNDVCIENTATVNAEIHAKNAWIRGRVEGKIFASEKVHIEKNGHMTGEIRASRISIDDGAQFKGSVKIVKPTPSSP